MNESRQEQRDPPLDTRGKPAPSGPLRSCADVPTDAPKPAESALSSTVFCISKSDEEWRQVLTPQQYQVTREHGTERAFTGEYWNCKEPGVYTCVCCGAPLFQAEAKFDSGTGWPSFWRPIDDQHVGLRTDNRLFMQRTEVHCRQCGAHLGHVFDDGPVPTGLRYCINSASLRLVKQTP